MLYSEQDINCYNEILTTTLDLFSGKAKEPREFFVWDFIIYRDGTRIGAAIPAGEDVKITNTYPARGFLLENRINLSLHTDVKNWLTLSADMTALDFNQESSLHIFVDMIMRFVQVSNDQRKNLLAHPDRWAKETAQILGNSLADSAPYPYIAELYLVNAMVEAGIMTDIENQYRGPEGNIHDFELPEFSMEAKSHLHCSKEEKKGHITISSEDQLNKVSQKPLYLVYFKMEKGFELSLEKETQKGKANQKVILEKLAKKNYFPNDPYWQTEYHLIGDQPMVFHVDDKFPKLTAEMFGGKFPTGISNVKYTVSLENLPCCPLDKFLEALKQKKQPVFES